MSKAKKSILNRRSFMQSAVATGAAAAIITRSHAANDQVPEGPALKIGVVGCGGRGTGAAVNALESAPNIQIVALADVFQDRIDRARQQLKERGQTIEDKRCFAGFDSYQKVIDSDIDYVILATPPHFRPEHFAFAVEVGKNVFIEKPVAVDSYGINSMFASAQKSEQKDMSVVAGTQRRHQKEYLETYRRIADGAIGDIVATRGYWNMGALWYREPTPEWNEMEYMIRDWVNWSWLSGDHIVEQHVHQIDVIHWFTGMNPVKAVGMGARMRRATGDQFDFFDVDFEHADGTRFHSMCRQINGCANNISEFVVGTKGSSNCYNQIYDSNGKLAWKYEGEKSEPYVAEHTDLVRAIRTGKPINEARQVTESTLTGILGRQSAYTGQEVSRDELLKSNFRLGPTDYAWGDVAINQSVPVPGRPPSGPKAV